MRLLVTRASDDASRTAERLEAAGHEAVFAPLISIVSTGADLPRDPFDAILATSVHALAGMNELPRTLAGAPWLVVGHRLAAALAQRGWGAPECVAADASALLAEISARYPEPFRFLYLAGRDRKPDLETTLAESGHAVTTVETYAAEPVAALPSSVSDELRNGQIDAVLHFSRRSAELLLALAPADMRNVVHVAISLDAAAPLRSRNVPVVIAATPDEAGMLGAMARVAPTPNAKGAGARQRRLADALRANLRRRKEQGRDLDAFAEVITPHKPRTEKPE